MINKIQKYLLIHYPTLWNIRLVPIMLLVVMLHALFFSISFVISAIDFEDTYYSTYMSIFDNGSWMLYVSSILVGILVLIGWLVNYSRNNALKNFYPRSWRQLYGEWLLVLFICSSIALLPVSISIGSQFRWQSTASYANTEKALNLLDKVSILIPANEYYYNYQKRDIITVPDSLIAQLTSNPDADFSNFSTSNKDGKFVIDGYTAPSLLYYYNYSRKMYFDESSVMNEEQKRAFRNINTVKKWLKEGQTDSIKALMQDFTELQRKHNLQINLTPDQWFERIYNPPFFPVNNRTMINSSNRDYQNNDYDRVYDSNNDQYVVYSYGDTIMVGNDAETASYIATGYTPSLPYDELLGSYQLIEVAHSGYSDVLWVVQFGLCAALWVSMFIFSFRISGGRSWLIAFVASGVLLFILGFVSIFWSEISYSSTSTPFISFSLSWIILFLAIAIYLLAKVMGKGNKGHSRAPINILCWLVPCFIPLTFMACVTIYDWIAERYFYVSDDIVSAMFWINIPCVIVAMIPITALIRRWKGLPEE